LSPSPAVCIQQFSTLNLTLNPNLNSNPDPDPNPDPNPNPKPTPNRNPTVITDPQIGRRDPQIVTIQIRPQICPLRILSCAISLGIKFWRKSNHMTSNDVWLNWGCREQEIPCFT